MLRLCQGLSQAARDTDEIVFFSIPGYLGITPLRNRNADYADYLSRLQNAQRAEGRQPWDDLPDYAAEYMVDSIVAIARALSSLPTALRRYGSNVTSQLRGLTFQGISGETSFTKEGDRLNPRYTIYNMQNSNRSGAVWVPVGEVGVDVGSAFLTEGIGSICWASFECGLDEPPSDEYPDPKERVDVWIPIVISVIAVLLLFVTWKYFGVRKKMGEMKNIDNELVDIQEQVEAAKLKQASLILKRSALQEKPDTWSDSTERLVPVPAEDDQYWTIDARLKATMPDAHISKLWRVQNTSLWTYYSFHRDRLTMHDISHNERSVWHGTSGLDPAIIYNDQLDGFMMQFAAKGFWGRGIYFADKSEYSHSYAYDPPAGSASSTWSRSSSTSFTPGSERSGGLPGEREMFLAKLLVGSSIELPRDQTLTVPPHDPTNNLKYNSVTGETGGSKVWIVYENGRAYPDYLVRYYRGKRDPKRTPYKSKRQAMKRADVDEMDADTMETGQVGGVSLNLDVPFTWMYLDSGGWVPYSSCHQSILENKHQVFVNDNSISSKVQIQTDEWTYEVDVKQMVQTNMGHADSRTRNVRRVVETGQAGGAI
jgi:type II secretory pathway pseudopilin PulG